MHSRSKKKKKTTANITVETAACDDCSKLQSPEHAYNHVTYIPCEFFVDSVIIIVRVFIVFTFYKKNVITDEIILISKITIHQCTQLVRIERFTLFIYFYFRFARFWPNWLICVWPQYRWEIWGSWIFRSIYTRKVLYSFGRVIIESNEYAFKLEP